MKFGLQATLQAQPGKGEELSTLMLEATKRIAELEGCELYVIQRSLEAPDLRYYPIDTIPSRIQRFNR